MMESTLKVWKILEGPMSLDFEDPFAEEDEECFVVAMVTHDDITEWFEQELLFDDFTQAYDFCGLVLKTMGPVEVVL